MASDETMTLHSSLHDQDFDDDIDDQHRHPHLHNTSRLSVCTSSTLCGADDEEEEEEEEGDDVDNAMTMYVSRLSMGSYEEGDGDADGEFSDGKGVRPTPALSSDSDNEVGGCYSLPATPPRRRRNRVHAPKDYASDNEAHKSALIFMGEKPKNYRPRSKRIQRNRWMLEGGKKTKEEESDEVRVITRPKGGRRSLCMDMEEMKACRDLGFELENERMVEMPSRLSLSNSTLDTSSGGNSPIANWRISSPGMLLILHISEQLLIWVFIDFTLIKVVFHEFR